MSNETTFGVCEWARVAKALDMPAPVSIQNSFSLLHRSYACELAEACAPRNHNIGLLPWSPLCGGLLTGKYGDSLVAGAAASEKEDEEEEAKAGAGAGEASGASSVPPAAKKARFSLFPTFQSRWAQPSAPTMRAIRAYEELAATHKMSAAALALRWCRSRWFAASTIIGATTMEQLKENIDAFDPAISAPLSDEVLAQVDAVHMESKDPCMKL